MNKPGSPQGNEGEIITILLVDDIPEARENIKKMIAFEPDMKVVGSAGTGREGVALAKELKPNIIIMDINMPDMDGITLIRHLREMGRPGLLIFAVSGYTLSAHTESELKQLGISGFISKPINHIAFAQVIFQIERACQKSAA